MAGAVLPGEGGDSVAGEQAGQDVVEHGSVACGEQRGLGEHHRPEQRHRGECAACLFEHGREPGEADAEPAVFLGHGDAGDAELPAGPRPECAVDAGCLPFGRSMWVDPGEEAAGHLA